MNDELKQNEIMQLQHPELWHLVLGIDDEKLKYLIYTPAQEKSLMTGDVALNKSGFDYLKAVENAVYDNPVLLNDFGRVTVSVRSGRFMLLPPEVGTDEKLAREAFAAAMPDVEGDFALAHLPHNDVYLAFEMPKGLLSFLHRTFYTPTVTHQLFALCESAWKQNENSKTARMHLNVGEHTLDVAVFHGQQLQLANSFRYTDVNDAAYFALHVWKSCNLNNREHEVIVSGDSTANREALTAALRTYLAYVMPAILPAAALRLGENAHLAPTELIQLALCE